jgi:hypothetical protein
MSDDVGAASYRAAGVDYDALDAGKRLAIAKALSTSQLLAARGACALDASRASGRLPYKRKGRRTCRGEPGSCGNFPDAPHPQWLNSSVGGRTEHWSLLAGAMTRSKLPLGNVPSGRQWMIDNVALSVDNVAF